MPALGGSRLEVVFYSNEGREPVHVHATKGEAECKFWLFPDRFDIGSEFEFPLTPQLIREVRQAIFDHFDQICAAWLEHFGNQNAS